jgi:hypothetical protein
MRVAPVGVAALLLFATSGFAPAADPIPEMMVWVPDRANAALFVDADAVLKSPIAKKNKWGTSGDMTTGLDSLPPNASHLIVASQFAPRSGAAWEVRLATMRKAVTEADLIKPAGGTRDKIAGKTVVLSPQYGLMTVLGPKVVGAYQPPNRQDAGRWLREAAGHGSAYLKVAAAMVSDQTPLVIAFDTHDMFDVDSLHTRYAASPALKGTKADPMAIAGLFAGLKGITTTVKLDPTLAVQIRFDFSQAPDALKGVEKAVILDMLEASGVRDKDMDKWQVVVAGNAVTFAGPATNDIVRDLVAPFLRPSISALDTFQSPGGKQDPKVDASVKYFQSVSTQYRTLRTTRYSDFPNLAYKYNTAARQIDDLPILNVDEELLAWGASVTTTIRTIAINAQLTGGQVDLIQANRTMSSISSPDYFYGSAAGGAAGYWGAAGYGYNYAVPTGTVSNYTVSNYAQIGNLTRMTTIQEQQFRVKTWDNVEKATTDVRRKMVKKYNVEF